jgi:hypothetical protein
VVVARAAAVGRGAALGVGRGGVAVLRRRGGCAVLGGLAAVVVPFGAAAAAGVACWVPLPAAVMQRRRCLAGGGAWQLGLRGGAGGRGSSGAGRWRGAAWMQQCGGGADWARFGPNLGLVGPGWACWAYPGLAGLDLGQI